MVRLWFVVLVLLAGTVSAQVALRTEFQDTQPKFVSEGNGKFSGLCLEIMVLLEKKSDLRFSYGATFVPIGRITEDLKAGVIDVYFGLAKTAQREKDFGFLDEMFRTRYELVARRGDPLLSADLETLRASGVPVLGIRGSASANYFQKVLNFPLEDAPSSVEVALKQLRAGNGRLFGYYDLGNRWYFKNLNFDESLAIVPVKLDEDSQWLCYSPKLDPETLARLRQAFATVKQSPEWATLMKKYFE